MALETAIALFFLSTKNLLTSLITTATSVICCFGRKLCLPVETTPVNARVLELCQWGTFYTSSGSNVHSCSSIVHFCSCCFVCAP